MAASIGVYGAGKVGRELIKYLTSNEIGVVSLLADPNHTMQEVIDLFNQDYTYGLPQSCTVLNSNSFVLTMPNGAYNKITYVQEADRSLLPLGSMGIEVIVDCSGNTENITTCAAQFITAGARNAITIVSSNISTAERIAIASDSGLTLFGINERSHSGNKWYIPDAQFISTILPSLLVYQYLSGKGFDVYNIDLNLQVSNLENSLLNSYTGYGSITGTLTNDSNYIGKLISALQPALALNGKIHNTNVCYPVGNGNVSKISIINNGTLTSSDIEDIVCDLNQFQSDGTSGKDKNTSGFFKVNSCGPVAGKYFLNYMSKLGSTMPVNNYTQNTFFIGYDSVNVMVCESKFLIEFIIS